MDRDYVIELIGEQTDLLANPDTATMIEVVEGGPPGPPGPPGTGGVITDAQVASAITSAGVVTTTTFPATLNTNLPAALSTAGGITNTTFPSALSTAGGVTNSNFPTALTNAGGVTNSALSATLAAYAQITDLPTTRATQNNTGTTDASAYLNGLISTVSAAGGGRIILSGTYRIDSGIIAKSDVTLDLTANAYLLKNFHDTTGAPGASMIRNNDFTAKVNNFKIIGTGKIGNSTAFSTHKGNIICIYGDDLVLTGFTIDGWSGGRAVSGVGDRWRISFLRIVNCTQLAGDGGIRYMGGNDGVCIGCHIESGDDAFQLVPGGGGSATNPNMYSQTIRRFSYIGGTGFSIQGRFMVVALQNRDSTATMTASIIDCSFIGMHGTGGMHLSFFVQNMNSTGDIDGLDFTDCTLIAGGTQSASVEGLITRNPEVLLTVGKIRRVSLKNFRLRGPRKSSMVTRGGVEFLTFQDCHFEKPTSSAVNNITTTNGSVTITAPAPVDPGNGDPLPPPPFSDVDLTAVITGPGIQVNTAVSAVSDDGLTITMSKTATATGVVTLTIGGTTTIDLTASQHTRIIGGSIQGGGSSNIVQCGALDRTFPNGATVNNATIDLSMRDVLVYDIPDQSAVVYGLNLNRVIGAKIDHCTFVSAAGGTTGIGIRVSSNSSKVKLADNDLTAIASATKINDLATDTKRTDNLGADTITGIAPTDVQAFTTAGTFTWTKPAGAVRVEAHVISGGGGGGSGRRGAAATIRCGGGGGAGGQRATGIFQAADLGTTEAITVGAGGAGGAAVTTDSTDGNPGVTGGQSLFGTGTTTRVLTVAGGLLGSGGTATTGLGGAAVAPGCSAGQAASTTGGVGGSSFSTGRASVGGAAGGGAGGGISSANVDAAGGAGQVSVSGSLTGATGGTAGGGAGQAVTAIRTNSREPGASGAGGGGSSVSAGGAGSAGGIHGGGGGGGGASLNGNASGAGGAGADGMVLVISYFQ